MSHRGRTYVVTGSASGMGLATTRYLLKRGATVVGVDLRGTEVIADLGTPEGRNYVIERVKEICDHRLDGLIACAGVGVGAGGGRLSGGDPATIVRVNYFGALAALQGLRELLELSPEPRAVAVGSIAMFAEHETQLVQACLDGDEDAAVALAGEVALSAYAATKRALAQWIRQQAPSGNWAGRRIILNAVAPSVIDTPMVRHLIGTDDQRAATAELLPLKRIGTPQDVASLLAWLVSPENRAVTGQVIFVDSGREAELRGPDIW